MRFWIQYLQVKAGKPEQEFDKKDSEKNKVETGNQVGNTNITYRHKLPKSDSCSSLSDPPTSVFDVI